MTEDRPVQPPPEAPSTPLGPPSGTGPSGTGPSGTGPSGTGPSGRPAGTPEGDPTAYGPPPITAFAWRNGLVRPRQGRILAGVCGAFGRATNTDPVLWRVILAVLTIFAGIGVLAYLIAWLILPADGDTASPIEALAGRGSSGTSTVLTVIGGFVVMFSLAAFVSEPFRAFPLLAVVLLGGALLLLLRDQRGRIRAAGTPEAPMWSAPASVAAAMPTSSAPGPTISPGIPAPGETGTLPPPFAPHGPFAGAASYPPVPPYAPPRGPVLPMPAPARKPPRSRLWLLTFSLVLLILGGLALIDLAAYRVPPAGYVAAALATVGLGLLLGAWFGRSRGLIAYGVILAVLLATIFGVNNFDGRWRGGTARWAPLTLEHLRDSYRHDVGDATLDLSAIDFAGTKRHIDVRIDLGSLEIIVSPNVDVTIDANVDVGNAEVFKESWSGLGPASRTVTDLGADGPGGGELRIDAGVDLGNLEVHR